MTRTLGNQESWDACDSTCVDRRLSPILLAGILMAISFAFSASRLAAQTNHATSTQKQAPNQHFVCNTGYTPQECQTATAILRKAQARYAVEALGEWTWILVRTADWKYALREKGVNVNDPAFSNLTKRVTFLDGSLMAGASIRGTELRMIWRMPIEDLLDLTIRHELAHALCNEHNEFRATRIAIAMKDGEPLPCQGAPVAKGDHGETMTNRVVGSIGSPH